MKTMLKSMDRNKHLNISVEYLHTAINYASDFYICDICVSKCVLWKQENVMYTYIPSCIVIFNVINSLTA